MDRVMRIMFVCGIVLFTGTSLLLYLRASASGAAGRGGRTAPTAAEQSLSIPAFNLIDQDGRPVDQRLFDGRVTIVDFIFTSCPMACPTMTGALSDLQKRLAGTGVQFVSFSFDPATDTPELLKKYAADFDADQASWRFLTEPRSAGGAPVGQTARTIYAKDLSQYFEDVPGDQVPTRKNDGSTTANINHGINFFLVGPDRRVIGWFNSAKPEEVESLYQRARAAAEVIRASEEPASRPGASTPRGR